MKNKLIITAIMYFVMAGFVQAQSRQSDTATYRTIIPVEKQSLMKNEDIIANMQMGLRNDFQDGDYLGSKFKVEQFRLEIKGYIHEKVFFRFRHRYTSTFEPQSIDKIIKGVDFAYLRFDASDKWQFTFGKTYADWGGYEFDLNPIDIYEYSDIIEMADNFLFAAGAYFQATKNHGISFQILNSRTGTFEELYDSIPTIEASKAPLAGVINWRGSFWDGKFTTLWSYSLFNEAKDIFKNYIALGNQLNLNKITIMYDFKWSKEDLDRTGIISGDVPDDIYNYALKNTLYYSHWLRFDYRFTPKWQASFVGIIDKAKWLSDVDPIKNTDDWRTAYTFIPTLEYFPWEDLNLKFYLGWVGRSFNYSEYSQSRFGLSDYSTGRLIFGIISPLHVL
jgi:hypothetical protein